MLCGTGSDILLRADETAQRSHHSLTEGVDSWVGHLKEENLGRAGVNCGQLLHIILSSRTNYPPEQRAA